MPRKRPQRRSSNLRARIAVFTVLILALAGGAVYALWPKDLEVVDATGSAPTATASTRPAGTAAAGDADVTIRITMEGFAPASLSIPANRPVRLKIVNPDNAHHSDGGGIHQFAVDKLGVNTKVKPETIQIITLPPAAEGEYDFYCDTCCGGKENPTMQGKLKVKAA